jgi:hypothetical protein
MEMIFSYVLNLVGIFAGQILREHSKVHILKTNRTLEQMIFLKKTLYYIKARDLIYRLIEPKFLNIR